jgi:hypothetical protein
MAKLTVKARNHLASSTFAGPDRSYPIPDASHARNALARASGKTIAPEVRAAVHRKFPGIGAKAKRYAQGVSQVDDVRRERNDPRPGDPARSFDSLSDALETGRYWGDPADKTQNMNMPGGAAGRGPTVENAGNHEYNISHGSPNNLGPTMQGAAGYSKGSARVERYASGTSEVGIEDMRKALGPPPPPKPETPSDTAQINQNFGAMRKAMGYASGTPSVPAPGQTQTNGSWGTSAPPPQPLPPSPLGGQNQNLRALLGMGKPRFAKGTADAGAENGLTRAMNAHADQCHPVRR